MMHHHHHHHHHRCRLLVYLCILLVIPAASSKSIHPNSSSSLSLQRPSTKPPSVSFNSKKKETNAFLLLLPKPTTDIASTTTKHLRGGECDSNPILYLKLLPSILLQTTLLYSLLLLPTTSLLPPSLLKPTFNSLPLVQYLVTFLVIFTSSFFGSIVDGTLSTASKQVLDPNVTPGESGWYGGLNRPSWEPPGWVFPIMWLIVSKPTQFLAIARLFRLDTFASSSSSSSLFPLSKKTLPLFIYCLHLALGDTWNKVFFGYQCIGRGAVVITAFWSVLVTSAVLFYTGLDERAGLWLGFTIGWVSVASALNWNIYLNN